MLGREECQWFGCRGTNSEGSESSKCSVLRDQHGATPTGEPRKGALLAIELFSVRWSNPPINGSWWSRSVVCKKLIQTSKNQKKKIGWKRLKREWRKRSVVSLQSHRAFRAIEPSEPSSLQSLRAFRAFEPSEPSSLQNLYGIRAFEPSEPSRYQNLYGIRAFEPSEPSRYQNLYGIRAIEPSEPLRPIRK
ncbi:hypothetical protein L207DRAFT_566608 [Hyaloscypha variabilis F]|uniref:Uncharacterized protein n=1 Tax=Hyaloscypha variabilis (strain UAMH 11265 / GT02V1 / F) TaxID=1149755 RepID=A0A2J6RMH2_HYAVF|nr:hypothetical protein L207DRAFT_566608 [Hyaloscypha variabilis F]